MPLGLMENLGVLLAYHHRREALDEAEPSATELPITFQIVLVNADLVLEEIPKGVKGGALGIDDQVGRFRQQETGLFIVGQKMRKAEHRGVRVPTHDRNVINQLMYDLIGITR